MTNKEKVSKIQYVIDHPDTMENAAQCYELLENMGDLKTNYLDYVSTDCDRELERLPEADYELSAVLLTLLLREDHFINGSFERRCAAGQVDAVLNRMIKTLTTEL